MEDKYYIGVEKGIRALYYAKSLHRDRVYRSSFPVPDDKDFKLFIYKNKKRMQKLCDYTNELHNSDYQPIEYVEK